MKIALVSSEAPHNMYLLPGHVEQYKLNPSWFWRHLYELEPKLDWPDEAGVDGCMVGIGAISGPRKPVQDAESRFDDSTWWEIVYGVMKVAGLSPERLDKNDMRELVYAAKLAAGESGQ